VQEQVVFQEQAAVDILQQAQRHQTQVQVVAVVMVLLIQLAVHP
jgi:hypothetical protein